MLPRLIRGAAAACVVVAWTAGCRFREPAPDWQDEREPAGACWDVDLGDGLDESSTRELHDLFACLNQSGSLDPLAELDEAADALTRSGEPVGADVAWLFNELPDLGIDVMGLAGVAVDLLESDDWTLEVLVELVIELMYGRSYAEVEREVELQAGSSLDRGVIRPALPLVRELATLLLDDEEDEILELIADAAAAEETADLVCSLTGVARTDDADAAALGASLLPDLGDALERVESPGNDRWSGASGDSARDLVEALLLDTSGDGLTPLEAMGDDVTTVLEDVTLMQRLRLVLEDADNEGHIDPLPLQLRYLVEVDVEGGSLDDGEDSALWALLRLLASANAPLDCSLDLWVTDLEVHLDNLSVELLTVLAQQDPDDIEDGVSLLGKVLGWSFSQSTLETIADSEVCPLLDRQMVSDLESLDRFNDGEVGDLLRVFLDILDAFHDGGGEDRIPELVDLLDTVHSRGLTGPLEEILRDLADSALMDDFTDLVPLILEPEVLQTEACPTGAEPLDFEMMWDIAHTILVEDDSGRRPLEVLEPTIALVLNHSATWTVIDNAAEMLRDDGNHLVELPEILARLVLYDPDLDLVYDHLPLLTAQELTSPVLRIVETEEVIDAVERAELSREGPMPFLARLVVGGTLDVLLRTVDLLLDWVAGLDQPDPSPDARQENP